MRGPSRPPETDPRGRKAGDDARREREARRMAAMAGVGATAGGVSSSLMASSIWQDMQHEHVNGRD